MDKRRSIIVALAVLLAVIAGAAVFFFLSDSSGSPDPSKDETKVLVAARALPASTKASQLIDSGAVKVVNQPKANLPADALLSLDQLAALAAQKKVLSIDVPDTTVLSASYFTAPGGSKSSFNASLEADQQLITIPSATIKGITAGLLKPGDRVNAIVTTVGYSGAVDGGAESAEPADAAASNSTTGYLTQNMEVYAIGATTATPVAVAAADGTAPAVTVAGTDITFRVNLVEATKLVTALHGGAQPQEIWLTLVSQEFSPVPAPVLTKNSLLTDNFAQGATAKEPASPAIPVKPQSSSTSAASN